MTVLYLNLLRIGVLLLGIASSAAETKDQDVGFCCKIIESHIPDRISYPKSTIYDESLSSYYSGQESELQPACIFSPTNATEVSVFVKLITSKCCGSSQFAVRSGGHSIWSGAANIGGGITVDMRSMNSLVLSHDKKVASLGAGGIWSEIYEQLVPYNLTVMGGRVAGIGVGGLATGGKFAVCLKSMRGRM